MTANCKQRMQAVGQGGMRAMQPEEYLSTLRFETVPDYSNVRFKTGDLYAFKVGPYVKIGIASQGWQRRIKAYETHCPFKIRKIKAVSLPLAGLSIAERYVHALLSEHRFRGEWFSIQKTALTPAFNGAKQVAHLVEMRLEADWLDRIAKRIAA